MFIVHVLTFIFCSFDFKYKSQTCMFHLLLNKPWRCIELNLTVIVEVPLLLKTYQMFGILACTPKLQKCHFCVFFSFDLSSIMHGFGMCLYTDLSSLSLGHVALWVWECIKTAFFIPERSAVVMIWFFSFNACYAEFGVTQQVFLQIGKLGGEGMSDYENVEFLTLMTEDDTASFAVDRVMQPHCQLQISYQIE